MIYQSGRMRLKPVRIVRKSEDIAIYVCLDEATADKAMYTLISLRNHEIVKSYLRIYQSAPEHQKTSYIDSFSYEGEFCMVFPYRQERPLSRFFDGAAYSLQDCEDVCFNLIIACMSSGLPYPVLYLILSQGLINIAGDHSIYFGYEVDFTKLDERMGERECVSMAANQVREILRSKSEEKATSYELLTKRIEKGSYPTFRELYNDVKMSAAPKTKRSIFKRLKAFLHRNRDRIFRILLVISVLLVFLVVISFISQVFAGEVLWLRIFKNSFKVIGTEFLNR